MVLLRLWVSEVRLRQVGTQPQPQLEDITPSPEVSPFSPAPVNEYTAPAPVLYAVPAPVVENIALAPVVGTAPVPSLRTSRQLPQCVTLQLHLSMSAWRRRLWSTPLLHLTMSTLRLHHLVTQHEHLSWRTWRQLPQCTASVRSTWMSTWCLRQRCTQHLRQMCYIALAPVVGAAPIPVVEDIAPTHVVSNAAPAPVGEYTAPGPVIAARKGYTLRRANGRYEHGLSPDFHREGVHWAFGRLVRCPTLRLACTTSSSIVNDVGMMN